MIERTAQRIMRQWFKLLSLVSLKPFDRNTSEGRASERHRRVVLSALASSLAKIITVLTVLISVPLTLGYLGAERYGMWMTISSLTAILAFADFGIGNGMLNAIAAANGRDDIKAVRVYVSSGFFALSLLSAALLGLFAAAYRFTPWASLFNVQSSLARQEAGPALAVFFVCFALAIPMSIVQRTQMALQRSFLSSLWQCVASVLGLVGVLVAIRQEASLPWLVLAFMGAPLAVAALNSVVFFGYMQRDIAPSGRAVTRTAAVQLVRTGGLFLVLQLVGAVAYASDSLVIAQLLGAAAVAEYAVPERMFSLITMVLAMVLAPLWPAYGEAIARGDIEWVRRTLRRSITIALTLSFIVSIALVLFGSWLIELWVGTAVIPSLALLISLAVWKTVESGGNALAVFLNGARVVRIQLILAILTAVSALALKIILIQLVGISGGVWASVLSYSLLTVTPIIFFLPRILRELR